MSENMSFEELQEIVSFCLDQISSLKEENASLKNDISVLTNALSQCMSTIKTENENIIKFQKSANQAIAVMRRYTQNIPYEWADPNKDKDDVYFPKFYSLEETIKKLADNRCSMARFGDGEFELMVGHQRHSFQHNDPVLSKRLSDIIHIKDEKFLVAIADNYGSLDKYNEDDATAIRVYMSSDVRKSHKQFLNLDCTYHNAYISRPYAMYADNKTDAPSKRFKDLQTVWQDRDIIFVEGCLTRLGVGNDLFDNAKSIKRIEAPATNSFDKYKEILDASLEHATDDALFLIALGPSAGVLAYDLYNAGYQAIDLGHLDLEYEWFLNGNGTKCDVPTKYNNEWFGGENVSEIHDEKYESEIVARIV